MPLCWPVRVKRRDRLRSDRDVHMTVGAVSYVLPQKALIMKTKGALIAACIAVALAGCASTGTKVTSTGDSYKNMAQSQQWWCGNFGDTCTCTLDGVKTTCSLVWACVNSGNCKVAQ